MKNLFKDIFSYKDIDNEVKNISKYEMLSQYLPFLQILSDSKTIITKNNTLVRVLKLQGVDNLVLSTDDQKKLFLTRRNLFKTLEEGVRLTFHTIRRKDDSANYGKFSDKYVEKINKIWNSQFSDSYKTEIYLVVTKKIRELTKSHNFKKFEVLVNSAMFEFDMNISTIKTLLGDYKADDLINDDS